MIFNQQSGKFSAGNADYFGFGGFTGMAALSGPTTPTPPPPAGSRGLTTTFAGFGGGFLGPYHKIKRPRNEVIYEPPKVYTFDKKSLFPKFLIPPAPPLPKEVTFAPKPKPGMYKAKMTVGVKSQIVQQVEEYYRKDEERKRRRRARQRDEDELLLMIL